MKKSLVLAMVLCLICSAFAFAEDQEIKNGRRLLITTYGADYTVYGGITINEDEDTHAITFSPTITIRDMAAKTTVAAWAVGETDVANYVLAGVANGLKKFENPAVATFTAAWTTMDTQLKAVAKAIQTDGKLVTIAVGSMSLLKKDGSQILLP